MLDRRLGRRPVMLLLWPRGPRATGRSARPNPRCPWRH